ncbi:MAG: trypsin-like peptidase domain-containing protein, partial [Nocardioidaceae bacterium]|nr:trypsin-like peptidase domain-containing protein [Nocardioidaceae bacterium]
MTTSEFPPAQHALYPPTTPAVARRGGRLVAAALLVGALAGGAAGVGGAAVLAETWSPDTSPPASAAGQPAPLSTSSGGDSSAPEGTPEAAAAEALPSVVKIYATSATQSGSGSGIVLTEDGEILTNNHVVELAASGGKLAVSFDDGRTAAASIVGRDPLTDLAVIDAAGVSGLTPAT